MAQNALGRLAQSKADAEASAKAWERAKKESEGNGPAAKSRAGRRRCEKIEDMHGQAMRNPELGESYLERHS